MVEITQQGGGMAEQYDRLIGEVALFLPGYERHSPVAPSDFDRLAWDTASLFRPPY